MRVRIKICGVTEPEAIEAAAEAGADAVGFVFADSPRRVSLDEAILLRQLVPPFLARVAVFRHPQEREVREVLDGMAPDWVQSDLADAATILLPRRCTFVPVLRDDANPDGATHRFLDATVGRPVVLFESAVSGAGRTADWRRAASLAMRTRLILAGGLNVENVEEAILRVRPYAVDVSSGVERQPGRKDPGRIAAFVAAVRRAERRLEDGR